MPTKKSIRQNEIHQIVLDRGSIRVKELSQLLGVTPETLRSDLTEMEQQKRLIRQHGIAKSISSLEEVSINVRRKENIANKRIVGVRALNLIEENQIAYIDAGSTLTLGLPALANKKNIVIVTNNVEVAYRAGVMDIKTIVCGGELFNTGLRTYGDSVIQTIDSIGIDIAILGTDGFADSNGFTTVHYPELEIKRHLVAQSKKIVMACDASKFKKRAPYITARFKETDILVTNQLTDAQRQQVADVSKIIEV